MIKRLYAIVALLALVAASSQAAACEVRCATQNSQPSCHSSMAADHASAISTVDNECPYAIKPVAINSIRVGMPAICAHTFNWAAVSNDDRAGALIHDAPPQMAAALPGAQPSAMLAKARQARIDTSPPPYLAASDPLQNTLRL